MPIVGIFSNIKTKIELNCYHIQNQIKQQSFNENNDPLIKNTMFIILHFL